MTTTTSRKRQLSETEELIKNGNENNREFKKTISNYTFSDLPEDVYTIIYTFLTINEKIRISRTNKLFYSKFLDPLSWTYIIFNIKFKERFIRDLIYKKDTSLLAKTINETTLLKHIKIIGFGFNDKLISFINQQNNLEILELTNYNMFEYLKFITCKNIKKIIFNNYGCNSKVIIDNPLIEKSIEVLECYNPPINGTEFEKFINLKEISIWNVNQKDLDIIMGLKKVERISITGYKHYTEGELMIKNKKPLDKLKVIISRIFKLKLPEKMDLKSLSIATLVSDPNLKIIENYESIQKLSIRILREFTSEQKKLGLKFGKLKNLEKLKIIDSDYSIIDESDLPSSLKSLHMTTSESLNLFSRLNLLEEIKLELSHFHFYSLDHLKDLKNLESLEIENGILDHQDSITDLEKLSYLKYRSVTLGVTKKSFKKLETFITQECNICNYDFLKGTPLKKLIISNPTDNNQIDAFSSFSTLEYFETIHYKINDIKNAINFEVLKNCKNLQTILLDVGAENYNFLINHPKLEKLKCVLLKDDDLKEIGKIKWLMDLEIKDLTKQKTTTWLDIAPLENNRYLQRLKVTDYRFNADHLLKMINLTDYESDTEQYGSKQYQEEFIKKKISGIFLK